MARYRDLCCLVLAILVTGPVWAQRHPGNEIAQRYAKTEVRIPMRDGQNLYTVVYTPRDTSRKYPIMMVRTPYSCAPYGPHSYPTSIGPSAYMEREGYIFVKQDVRGRWMSDGDYDNMRPHVDGDLPIDESSDTYDTIEWLLQNLSGHNGKVGMWGISYPGFYTAAALPEHHPALVAASPQAPISDFFFDDFHHHGAYLLSYLTATNTFGFQQSAPTPKKWYPEVQPFTGDAWTFFMNLGPLSNATPMMGQDNFFWQQLVAHPNYDEFWQRRSILPHLEKVKTNVMTVGGWFDAEDLYGPLNIYRKLERSNPGIHNTLVMGPWSHGDWARRNSSYTRVGNLSFGQNQSDFYQREIEAPFFRRFLKGEENPRRFEAMVFDTGRKRWDSFEKWPPADATSQRFYLLPNRQLATTPPHDISAPFSEFISDPADPVPYRARQDIRFRFTPRPYMSDDQRFATQREDVLVFQTEVLADDVTIAGDLLSHLKVSTTGTAADWVVKLIDVYPDDHPQTPGTPNGVKLAGYQQMVRSEVMRGRFRNSYEKPEPFVPGQVAEVNLPLQDIYHTFKKGHRIMVHVQSTWFPLIDRNPQTYVDNIFYAKPADFMRHTHRVHHHPNQPSWLEMKVRPGATMGN